MAQHSVSRTQALAKNKDTVKDRALTLTQTHTIETEVLRAPAQDLALLLDMLLSAPLMAEVTQFSQSVQYWGHLSREHLR